MAREQDNQFNNRIDKSSANVAKLKLEAQNFSVEAKKQVILTKRINENVEKTETKMKKIDSRLDKFVANTDDKKVMWYIIGQIVILVMLIIIS